MTPPLPPLKASLVERLQCDALYLSGLIKSKSTLLSSAVVENIELAIRNMREAASHLSARRFEESEIDELRERLQSANPAFRDRVLAAISQPPGAPAATPARLFRPVLTQEDVMGKDLDRYVYQRNELLKALQAVIAEPHGCPMCDSGKLRNPEKDHWDTCPYVTARNVIANVEQRLT